MSSTTPIYSIPYPDGSDLVSRAPEQLKAFAEGVETALDEVDRRATVQGATPIVRATKTLLDQVIGVTGQTGYVTADPTQLNNGVYHYTGTEWAKDLTVHNITFDRSGFDSAADTLEIDGFVIQKNTAKYIAFVTVRWVNKGKFTTTSWTTVVLARMTDWTATRESMSTAMENIAYDTLGKNAFSASDDVIRYVTPAGINIDAGCWHSGSIIFPVNPK